MLNWTTEPGWRMPHNTGSYIASDGSTRPYENSVPNDIVRLDNGLYRMYYMAFRSLPDGAGGFVPGNITLSAISPDLLNWTTEPGVRIDSGLGGGMSDSTYALNAIFTRVFRVPGGYRLFFAGYAATQIPGASGPLGNFFLHTAISPDGLNFVVEPGLKTFPQPYPHYAYRAYPSDIIQTHDGMFRIYLCSVWLNGRFFIASIVSPDGLNWVAEPGCRLLWAGTIVSETPSNIGEFRISAVVLPCGGVRLFIGCLGSASPERGMMISAISSDGLNFVIEPGIRTGLGGSSAVRVNPLIVKIPGGYRMIYGIGSVGSYPEFYGKIYSAVSYE